MPRELSWYPWSPADYRADTRHLTRAQHHAYREILDEIFLKGQGEYPPSIPDDDQYLYEISMASSDEEWIETRRVLIDGPRAVLQSRDGRISQKRMTFEIEKSLGKSAVRKMAAEVRWKAFQKPAGSTISNQAIPTHAKQPKNAATGSPRTHKRNGNGSQMSDQQFLYYSGRIAKWWEEHRELYHGMPASRLDSIFERDIGISMESWEREQQARKNANA